MAWQQHVTVYSVLLLLLLLLAVHCCLKRFEP
jgi:hypothetical protein